MTKVSIIESGLTARLRGPRTSLDRRTAIATAEIVDIGLAGVVTAACYVDPVTCICHASRTPLRLAGHANAAAVSELLFGEAFALFDCVGDWGFGRSCHDGYTGWVALTALGDGARLGTLSVTARSAPVFASADIKAPVIVELPLGARLIGAAQGGFLACAGGFVHVRHLTRFAGSCIDAVRLFTGAPYVWGGRTPFGVDCSGLVQAALALCGVAAPRDSDQQREQLGVAVAFADRRGGDLLFFPGHVGILVDADTLFHANAHWMAVVAEPLADVIARGAEILAVRRLP